MTLTKASEGARERNIVHKFIRGTKDKDAHIFCGGSFSDGYNRFWKKVTCTKCLMRKL